jgi:hypothetical protein
MTDEKIFKRCPKCNYNHFATEVIVQQKALIGGEGEYLDEYESELTNPVVSDSTVWECTRCGHKAPGTDFSVKESGLKDKELADVFSMYVDPVMKDVYVFYKGNERIGETDKTATLQEIKAEIAKHGYYLVDADDLYSENVIVRPLRFTAEISLSNGKHTLNMKIENITDPDDVVWGRCAKALYYSSSEFSESDNFECDVKITSSDNIVYKEARYSFTVSDGTFEF